ncbi:hypothetical protein [Saccharomonospora saliphila]|uniref:hypothetical protein n=1 Tax=Saccharomonospora saliphila TaxID=369829 RepID=UPI00036BCC81|nr:hypothetical protein [Saccharomonospora saliphila]
MSGEAPRDSSETARPGSTPGGSGPEGLLIAALFGDLSPHPWRDPAAASEDPHSLFEKRSRAMGWLSDLSTVSTGGTDPATDRATDTETGGVAPAGSWSMHEAGPELPGLGPDSPLAAWFQVGIGPVPADRPLPVQPFLCCADDVLSRFGALTLRAVQMLLPVHQLRSTPRRAMLPSLDSIGWFSECEPRARTEVRLTMDSGTRPSIPAIAPELLRSLRREEQTLFVCDSYSVTDHPALAERSPFSDHHWSGPPRHRATFHGTLAEWSLDAVGWLAAFLADATAREDLTAPVLLTIGKADLPPGYRGTSSVTPPARR